MFKMKVFALLSFGLIVSPSSSWAMDPPLQTTENEYPLLSFQMNDNSPMDESFDEIDNYSDEKNSTTSIAITSPQSVEDMYETQLTGLLATIEANFQNPEIINQIMDPAIPLLENYLKKTARNLKTSNNLTPAAFLKHAHHCFIFARLLGIKAILNVTNSQKSNAVNNFSLAVTFSRQAFHWIKLTIALSAEINPNLSDEIKKTSVVEFSKNIRFYNEILIFLNTLSIDKKLRHPEIYSKLIELYQTTVQSGGKIKPSKFLKNTEFISQLNKHDLESFSDSYVGSIFKVFSNKTMERWEEEINFFESILSKENVLLSAEELSTAIFTFTQILIHYKNQGQSTSTPHPDLQVNKIRVAHILSKLSFHRAVLPVPLDCPQETLERIASDITNAVNALQSALQMQDQFFSQLKLDTCPSENHSVIQKRVFLFYDSLSEYRQLAQKLIALKVGTQSILESVPHLTQFLESVSLELIQKQFTKQEACTFLSSIQRDDFLRLITAFIRSKSLAEVVIGTASK